MRRNQRSPEAEAYRKLYHTTTWRRVRAAQLQAHPLCARCLERGRYIAATVCHHTDPTTKESPATFYAGPFTSLCKPCHDRDEQQIERRGYSTRVGADGWPEDERHPANRR